jgi:hypothetical protein
MAVSVEYQFLVCRFFEVFFTFFMVLVTSMFLWFLGYLILPQSCNFPLFFLIIILLLIVNLVDICGKEKYRYMLKHALLINSKKEEVHTSFKKHTARFEWHIERISTDEGMSGATCKACSY